MLMPAFEKIYLDSMIVQNLYDVVGYLAYTEVKQAITLWKSTSGAIEELIPRIALADAEQSKKALDCWKSTLGDRDDFRSFAADIEDKLIPIIKESVNILYGPIRMGGDKWSFEKTPSGFMTIKDVVRNCYIHSPSDPMREATKLADRLYDTHKDEYHILGCGLGYLPYQIWIRSDKSAHIYVYDDDAEIIEFADKIGVLSWIDENFLTVVHSSDADMLLKGFIDAFNRDQNCTFISDWKVGGYFSGRTGELIENIDFSARTNRVHGKVWEINKRANLKKKPHSIDEISEKKELFDKEVVLVAAGPSLDENIDFIRHSKGHRIIIAVNTVLKRLEAEKIKPDLIVMLSPGTNLGSHIEGIEEFTEDVPMIMPLCGSRAFAGLYRGPIYSLDDEDMSDDRWGFGGTVTSFGLSVSYYLKAREIYLIGCDLAFIEGRNYSQGVAHGIYDGVNNSIEVESSAGGKVKTNNLYNQYRGIIERQIADHPQTKVYNMAKHGAKISGTVIL